MKKIPLILTLVCTTLTWNHKTLAAEKRSDSSSNPFMASDDSSTPLARLVPERGHTPPPLVVVTQLERAASESWDAERERLSKSATSSPIKAAVSPARKALVQDDDDPELQRVLQLSMEDQSSPPKSQGGLNRSLLDEEAERRYQKDVAKAMARSSTPEKSNPLNPPQPSAISSPYKSSEKEGASSKLTGGSTSFSSALPPIKSRVAEEDDGLQEALRQIAEQEKAEAAEKERKVAAERLQREQEIDTAKEQLDEVRKRRVALQVQMEELSQLESSLSSIYLDLISRRYTTSSSLKEGSSGATSNGSSLLSPISSSSLAKSGSSSDNHSSDSSTKGDDKK